MSETPETPEMFNAMLLTVSAVDLIERLPNPDRHACVMTIFESAMRKTLNEWISSPEMIPAAGENSTPDERKMFFARSYSEWTSDLLNKLLYGNLRNESTSA